MAKSSPTRKSLKYLRDAGYTVAVTERWNAFAKVRQDLFGFIDLTCLHPDVTGVIGVQTTTRHNMKARKDKILALPAAHLWMKCGNVIWIHGWDGQVLHEEVVEVFGMVI